jgi:rubrerythrin
MTLATHFEAQADEARLRRFFQSIETDLLSQARFANTLSFLEYVGARKILKSQPEQTITSSLLSHVAEEIRHAGLFKKIALEMSGDTLKDYALGSLWDGKKAWSYFQGLDQAAAQLLQHPDPQLNYLLTTYGIESRALHTYKIYCDYLPSERHRKWLSGILREEESHLKETETELLDLSPDPKILADLLYVETALFWTWFDH